MKRRPIDNVRRGPIRAQLITRESRMASGGLASSRPWMTFCDAPATHRLGREGRRGDRDPMSFGVRNLDAADHRGPVDGRIAQPVIVALGNEKRFCGAGAPAGGNPVRHHPASGQEGDDVAYSPGIIGPRPDPDSRPRRQRRAHARAMDDRMDYSATLSRQRPKAGQILQARFPRRSRDKNF